MASVTELDLYQRLDSELVALADNFSNMVRAARAADDEGAAGADQQQAQQPQQAQQQTASAGGGRDARKAPGELMEVLAEKLLLSGHTAIHLVSELKKGAMLSDFPSLIDNVRGLRNTLEVHTAAVEAELASMKADAHALLNELELHYYGCSHRGQLAAAQADASKQGTSDFASFVALAHRAPYG